MGGPVDPIMGIAERPAAAALCVACLCVAAVFLCVEDNDIVTNSVKEGLPAKMRSPQSSDIVPALGHARNLENDLVHQDEVETSRRVATARHALRSQYRTWQKRRDELRFKFEKRRQTQKMKAKVHALIRAQEAGLAEEKRHRAARQRKEASNKRSHQRKMALAAMHMKAEVAVGVAKAKALSAQRGRASKHEEALRVESVNMAASLAKAQRALADATASLGKLPQPTSTPPTTTGPAAGDDGRGAMTPAMRALKKSMLKAMDHKMDQLRKQLGSTKTISRAKSEPVKVEVKGKTKGKKKRSKLAKKAAKKAKKLIKETN